MSYVVLICPRTQRQIRGLAPKDQNRLKAHIMGLTSDPRPAGAAAMREVPGAYRLRAGDYSIVYTVHEGTVTVLVLQVAHRREAYRGSDIDAIKRDARQWLDDQQG